MTADLLIRKSADISPCGRFRTRLAREWGTEPPLSWAMLNPSTGDADLDDPSIRRTIGFSRREGAGGTVIVNLYPYRATKPSDLAAAGYPQTLDGERALYDIATDALRWNMPIVCAWGARRNERTGFLVRGWMARGVRLVCLGKTKDGSPRHPLYVRADQPLEAFP